MSLLSSNTLICFTAGCRKYRKKSEKYHTPQKGEANLKFGSLVLQHTSPKVAAGMADSVDMDQSDLGLHCLPRPVCPNSKVHYKFLAINFIPILNFTPKIPRK